MTTRSKAALLFVLLALAVRPAMAAQDRAPDLAAIGQVVDAFRTSIIEKDRARFTALFLSEDPAYVSRTYVDALRAQLGGASG